MCGVKQDMTHLIFSFTQKNCRFFYVSFEIHEIRPIVSSIHLDQQLFIAYKI